MSHKSFLLECPTRVSHKSFLLECPTRVSYKSVIWTYVAFRTCLHSGSWAPSCYLYCIFIWPSLFDLHGKSKSNTLRLEAIVSRCLPFASRFLRQKQYEEPSAGQATNPLPSDGDKPSSSLRRSPGRARETETTPGVASLNTSALRNKNATRGSWPYS